MVAPEETYSDEGRALADRAQALRTAALLLILFGLAQAGRFYFNVGWADASPLLTRGLPAAVTLIGGGLLLALHPWARLFASVGALLACFDAWPQGPIAGCFLLLLIWSKGGRTVLSPAHRYRPAVAPGASSIWRWGARAILAMSLIVSVGQIIFRFVADPTLLQALLLGS